MNEIIAIFDDLNQPCTGVPRDLAIKNKHWRRASGGIVYDPTLSRVLCHRRSSSKDERPDLWVATFGGKVGPNESVLSAALRELHEEFGIDTQPEHFIYAGTVKSTERTQFEYVFVLLVDSLTAEIKSDPDEVSETAWVSAHKCMKNLRNSTSWYSYGYEISVIRLLCKISSVMNSEIQAKKIGARLVKLKPLSGAPKDIVNRVFKRISAQTGTKDRETKNRDTH